MGRQGTPPPGKKSKSAKRKKVVNDNRNPGRPTPAQLRWLERGLQQPGGKLPLFDINGSRVDARVIRTCLNRGWAERWLTNPIKSDWLVCRLTVTGKAVICAKEAPSSEETDGRDG